MRKATGVQVGKAADARSRESRLYHATRSSNLDAILKEGLLARFWGAVHGGMEIHPPKPAVYLSRSRDSDNLHTSLFDGGPVVIIAVDASRLDEAECWPDDAIYQAFAEERILTTPRQVSAAFGVGSREARSILARLENARDEELPALLKPCWRWYLESRDGGEVAYTADVPPDAIVGYRFLERTLPMDDQRTPFAP